jgi:hypothetical protein
MRTTLRTSYKLKPGRRTAKAFSKKDSVYYSFTLPSAQSGSGAPDRILPECVRGASLARNWLESAQKAGPDRQRFLNAKCRY